MADINKVFNCLRKPKEDPLKLLEKCHTLMVCPKYMRDKIIAYIDEEIKQAQLGNKAEIIIKVNSFSDKILIKKINEAAICGVKIKMIIRGISCFVEHKKSKVKVDAISIVDEYLEHARVMYFYNKGNERMYISSADWMIRNLDYRVEVAVPILQKELKKELKELLDIQLSDNIKARVLNEKIENKYVKNRKGEFRSQIEIFRYLKFKTLSE